MDISVDKAIAGLDLDPIKGKLMSGKPGAGWSRERADAAEKEYRRFLLLMKMFPNELAAPTMDVDRFWHHHIVDTAKYARDCESVFGYFLHRYPYLGMVGDADAPTRHRAGARMRELYGAVFGQPQDTSNPAALSSTGFAIAVQSTSQTDMRGPTPTWPASSDPDEPDEAGDLLDQLRFVVIENQRYDRMNVPLM
jgi:hypothetical protein